ncbi:hypothetical protein A2U01_0086232, partial [Trifolium medium]|nr:hypothetical protein [Trifolium medium]
EIVLFVECRVTVSLSARRKKADQCKKGVVCFNCKEASHKSNVCKKPRVAGEKVFALDGGDVEADNLIR